MQKAKIRMTLIWEGELERDAINLISESPEDALEQLIMLSDGDGARFTVEELDDDDQTVNETTHFGGLDL